MIETIEAKINGKKYKFSKGITLQEVANEVERERKHQEKEYLGPREMAAYIISGIGDKNWETFNGNNEFFYTTTFQHVSPITLSVAQSFCSILDTFDNAISGPILDRTRTRWGRVRPYLVLTLPFFIFSAAMPYTLFSGMYLEGDVAA